MDLLFEDITVKIGDKLVLDNVFGAARKGHLLAVMGASGSGKTTLLNTLMGRLPLADGYINSNGFTVNKTIRRRFGYVLQADVFFPNITLKNTLYYTAMLSLPEKMPHKEKLRRINVLVEELELTKCLDTQIMLLSGGEKKRANIACELLMNPRILLMDEPTSGLDSTTAFFLIQNIRKFTAQHGKTVLLTIHQPSSQIFNLFDRILLLEQGKVAYFGEREQISDFFNNIGLECAPHYNIADFILDQMKADKETLEKIHDASERKRASHIWQDEVEILGGRNGVTLDAISDLYTKNQQPSPKLNQLKEHDEISTKEMPPSHHLNGNSNDTCNNGPVKLVAISNQKSDLDTLKIEMKNPDPLDGDYSYYDHDATYQTSFTLQFGILFSRNLRQNRPKVISSILSVQHILISFVICLLWWQIGNKEERLQDRISVIFMILMYWIFQGLILQISSFIMDLDVVSKERASGSYYLTAYMGSKFISDCLLLFPLCTICITGIYWSAGLNGVGAFFGTLGIVFHGIMVGVSLGFLLTIATMDPMYAGAIMACVILTLMLTAGFFVRNIPIWISWIKYLSFMKYMYDSLLQLEFTNGFDIRCANNTLVSQFESCHVSNVTSIPSESFFDIYPIELPLWANIIIVFGYSLGMYLAAYAIFRFIRKPARNNTD